MAVAGSSTSTLASRSPLRLGGTRTPFREVPNWLTSFRKKRLLREADKATGLPEEKDYLERAQSDFERAQEYYRDIVPFAGSASSLRRVTDFIDHVELRLKIVREGA